MKNRTDIVGLSTDTKPITNLLDGATFYCVDNGDLYVFYKGEWYLQEFVTPEALTNVNTRELENTKLSNNISKSENLEETNLIENESEETVTETESENEINECDDND